MAGKPKLTRTESSFSDQVPQNRATETRRDNDTVNTAKVSLYDIDSAIIKYIDQTIAPTIGEQNNGSSAKVPVIYASPEKWVSIQRDRYYRDAKNKIFAPLIAIRRESFDFNEAYPKYVKDRDAFTFETKYNKQNRYDKFASLNGVKPVREFHVVDMPRYVTVQYNLIIWTELTEQLNAITELFSYHSGLAWGDTFKFTSTISSFQFENINVTEQDRVIRATTTLTVSGYLIPDSDKKTETQKKIFSKSKIIFDSAERAQLGGAALANVADAVDLTDVLIFDQNNDFIARVPAGSSYRIPADFVTTASFYAFTASYNTGSFTGSFRGDGSQLTGIVSSKWTGSNPITRNGNVEISGSLTVSGSSTFRNIGAAIFTGSAILNGYHILTSNDTGSLLLSSLFNAFSASYNTGSFTGSFTGSLFGTASFAATSATSSNILGGKATHVPFFITDTRLATSSIYQSGSSTVIINQDNATEANPEALYVYQPSTSSFNVISGKGNLNNYLQLNIQNTNNGDSGSSDVVATANNGDESSNYIDMGINGENYSQNFIGGINDAYLYSTGRHLHIGNASNFPVQIFAGGSDVDIHNKLELNPNNQHKMSGSLDVSGSIKAFSFTGSLQGNATSAITAGTASYSTTLGASLSQPANNQVRLLNSAGNALSTATINNVTSASHADNASTADYAAIAGNGGVSQIIAGSGVTLIPSSGQGNVTVIATGVGGVTIISGSLVTGSFINTNSYTFNHNLNTRTPIITVFDSNYNQIIPENIQLVDSSSAVITFPTLESGFAIGSTGGTTGTALSASYALFSTYADTASFYQETDPVFVAKSASFATTGSNTFTGTQTITGSNGRLIYRGTTPGVYPANTLAEIHANDDYPWLERFYNDTFSTSSAIMAYFGWSDGRFVFHNESTQSIGLQVNGFGAENGLLVYSDKVAFVNNVEVTGSLNVIGGITGSLLGTASYANNADLLDGRDSTVFATTGSNTFRGNQTVTGSLFTSGSNTLIGNTVLSGSLGISGSQTFYGVSNFYGNHTLSGSNTISGNTILSGSLEVSGSSNFHNSEFIVTGSTSILGNFNVKGTSVFSNTTFTVTGSQYFTGSSFINGNQSLTGNSTVTGSLNVIGDINVVSGSSFTRWGNKLFNYGQFSDRTTQTGSANTAYAMRFDTTDFALGVSVVSGSRITVENTGIYNLQFSAQLANSANTNISFDIWFAYTGSNIAHSNTQIDVNKSAGQLGRGVAAWNLATPIQANDYIEIYWSCNANTGQLATAPSASVPTRPEVPSVIATLTQIA